MIIQRLSKGIKEQDWFVVMVEVMIVVVGIFIGLQVDDWQKEQERKENEIVYLTRLHEEITAMLPIALERQNFKGLIGDHIQTLITKIDKGDEANSISSEQCLAILTSHRYSHPSLKLFVISELMDTGNIQYIHNENIKNDIINYLRVTVRREGLVNDIMNNRIVLSNDFPELIKFSTHPEDRVNEVEKYHKCLWGKMRTNQLFLNQFLDNSERYVAYANSSRRQLISVQNLHDHLDEVLGLKHEIEGTKPLSYVN